MDIMSSRLNGEDAGREVDTLAREGGVSEGGSGGEGEEGKEVAVKRPDLFM